MSDQKSISFRELFLRNKRALLGYLTRRVGREDASDLLQETFVRALRHERFDAVADPPAFLQQIAVNLTRDFARRRKTEAVCLEFGEPPAEIAAEDLAPDERLAIEEKRRRLRAAVEALPPRAREVFALFMYGGLTVEEIAERLGIARSTAHKHMRLALQRCRSALD
jgi:RNA polymerase sigma-70 factor (ECF subfamily)